MKKSNKHKLDHSKLNTLIKRESSELNSELVSSLIDKFPDIYQLWKTTRLTNLEISDQNEILYLKPSTLADTFILSVSDGVTKAKTISLLLSDLVDNNSVLKRASKPYELDKISVEDFMGFLPEIFKKLTKLSNKFEREIQWIRVEWLKQASLTSWSKFQKSTKKFKRNYYRSGIAFKGIKEPWLLLTEMELNANACLYLGHDVAHAGVNQKNLNILLKARHGESQIPEFNEYLPVLTFNTSGVFFDISIGEYHHLETKPRHKGHRVIPPLNPHSIKPYITQSTSYLSNQVLPTGKYVYGYFPCFDRTIDNYNNLRHASSTYALIEGYEAQQKFTKAKLKNNLHDQTNSSIEQLSFENPLSFESPLPDIKHSIDKALTYLIDDLIKIYDLKAYVIDMGNEIKLGANAVAILAIVKYLQVFADTDSNKEVYYKQVAEKLAVGILDMQQQDGSFVHVLHSNDLAIKNKFRIIYYDGEAAFALMRLYGLTGDERWLNCVERALDYFIQAKHSKAHDHWLSYCTNELIRYKPEKKYFQFSVDNVKGYTDFIKNRITTFPTLLELSMAFHKTLLKLDSYPQYSDVLDGFDVQDFYDALNQRANYLLNGFFFPEVAMFFKAPQTILHGFFIRHHTFRVRIDDVEHYLSGLIAYQEMLEINSFPNSLYKRDSGSTVENNKELMSQYNYQASQLEITPTIDNDTYTSTFVWGGDVNLGRRQHYLTAKYGVENVLDVIALKEADFTLINLECVVSVLGEQGRAKGEGGPYYYRARPEMIEVLLHAGVDAVACANNHSGDYGVEALLQQGEILNEVGIEGVGTGENRETAFAPIYHHLPNGVRLAIFSVDATISRYAVDEHNPGAAYLDPKDYEVWSDTYKTLFEQARQKADLLLVAIHWGANGRYEPDRDEYEIGHRLIDAGADAILGASAHQLQGIEVYKNKPIIHDAGDLLFDAVTQKTKSGGVFQLDISQSGIERVRFIPVEVGYGQTLGVKGHKALDASRDFATKCLMMSTSVRLHEEGSLSITVKPSLIKDINSTKSAPKKSTTKKNLVPINYSKWAPQERSDLVMDDVPKEAQIEPVNFGALQLVGIRTRPYFFNRRRMLWVESFWKTNEVLKEDIRIQFRAKPSFETTIMSPWGLGTDHDPCDWLIPTSKWQVGKVYRDFYGLRPPYTKTWEDGTLQLEVRALSNDKTYSYIPLPFTYALNLNKSTYRGSLPKGSEYKQKFPDKVYEKHTKGTWNAIQLEAITEGEWLVKPPKDWYVDSIVAAGKHIPLAKGKTLFVANTTDHRHIHEGYSVKPKPVDRHHLIKKNQDNLVGAIVARPVEGLNPDFPVLQVKDPIKAWIEIGIAARSRFTKPVIGITGTVGKSSASAMLEAMLGEDKNVLMTLDNYNSRVGVLGSLASLSMDHDAAVIEIAQSSLWTKSGPITLLVKPNIALITEIGLTQTKVVKSLKQAVDYKCRIFKGLSGDAIAVVGTHLPYFEEVLNYAKAQAKRVMIYGDHPKSEIRIKSIISDYYGSEVELDTNRGTYSFRVPVPTEGQAKSAIAAFAVVYAMGEDLDIACRSIEKYAAIEGRLQVYKLPINNGHITLIDDNWNAAYDSMINAFSLFETHNEPNKRLIYVLGRLVDMGGRAKEMHQLLAGPLLNSKPDLVITHGDEMKYLRKVLPNEILGEHFNDAHSLADYLIGLLQDDDVILVKGSSSHTDFSQMVTLLKDKIKNLRIY